MVILFRKMVYIIFMGYKKEYWFYRCYHCGMWHYSPKRIKRKKCLRCRRSFKFEKATKKKYKIYPTDAPKILGELKKREIKKKEHLI